MGDRHGAGAVWDGINIWVYSLNTDYLYLYSKYSNYMVI